ncbi:MAG TPA: OsmC family protein [Spirochaetia bacterium]|nr:OsmC family protein [Spirochaetia bacterium]
MSDLTFFIHATAKGAGKDREGVISVDGHSVRFSAPASMGGKGVGASPETLLISAVTACYSLTLLALLQKHRLPCTEIAVSTDGVVTGFPQHDVYSRVVVSPTYHGADAARSEEYKAAAVEARDRCFIGQTVHVGGVAYDVGEVSLS